MKFKGVLILFLLVNFQFGFGQVKVKRDTIVDDDRVVLQLLKHLDLKKYSNFDSTCIIKNVIPNPHQQEKTDTVITINCASTYAKIYNNFLNSLSLLNCKTTLDPDNPFPFNQNFVDNIGEYFYKFHRLDIRGFSKVCVTSYEGIEFVFEPRDGFIYFTFEDKGFE